MKVIFLDIDGVMNSEDWYRFIEDTGLDKSQGINRDIDYRGLDIDYRAVKLLKLYIETHDIHIVISSSWRDITLKQTLLALAETPMIDVIDRIIGQTPHRYNGIRGKEIEMWLADHPEVDEFYIIDDDDFDIHQKDRLIKTDYMHGLTQEDLDKMTWKK